MQRRLFLSYLLGSAASLSAFQIVRANEKPLILGVFPRRNIKATYQLFTPLVDYLSERLNRKVILETSKSFKEFWLNVKQQHYDIVHFNQYHYIVSHQEYGYDVFATNKEFGKTTLTGAIFVRVDSGYKELSDLRGKTILFGGGRRAMQSYIATTWLLRQAGLQAGDYIEKFSINPPNTLLSTYFKRADASGAGDITLKLDNVRKRIDITQLKILAQTKPLVHLPWATRNTLPDTVKRDLKSIFTSMSNNPTGLKILKAAKVDGFVPVNDSDFDEHRKIIIDVYGSDYGVSFLR